MKKNIAILALFLGAVSYSFAQGTVTFANGTTTKISQNSAIGGPATSTISGANAFYFALFYSTSSGTVAGNGTAAEIPTAIGVPGSYAFSDPNWNFSGAYGASAAKAGTFGSTTLDSNGFTEVSGLPSGSASFVVIGWSANIGSSIANLESFLAPIDTDVQGGIPVLSGLVGESNVGGPLGVGSGTSQPPTLFSATAPDIQGFTLGEYTAVPEPSSIALGVMGAASLLALRRKKA
jgi:hypothetical protein